MRLSAQAKGGFYPTPDRVVDMAASLISASAGHYNRSRLALRILDPCCGAGEALERLAEKLGRDSGTPLETFGVELHRERAEAAADVLDHSLASDLFQASIANGVFSILFLNPPYDCAPRNAA